MAPALVIDYSFSHPDPAAIKAAGYVGVMRYLSYDANKNLTPAELSGLHAAGLAVGLIWEAGATDELGGADTGALEYSQAESAADALGWPADRPVFFAADFAASGGQLETVAEYMRSCVGGRPAGIYGGIQTVDTLLAEGICAWGWQTSAWSGSAVSSRAQLYQRQRPTTGLTGSFDEDVALADDWGGFPPVVAATVISSPAPPFVPPFPGQIEQGSVGAAVVAFQRRLAARGWSIRIDGDDGPDTTATIEAFQRQKGLAVDGIGGPITWRALWVDPVTPG